MLVPADCLVGRNERMWWRMESDNVLIMSTFALLEKAKLARKLVTEKMIFLTNFLVAKFSDGIREEFHVFPH